MSTLVNLNVDSDHAGLRLDVFLADVVEDASRSFLKKLIKGEQVSVNEAVCATPSHTLREGDDVSVTIPPAPKSELEPEDIPLDILHEDGDILVINKPSGLVVHPAPGHYTGTLVQAVLYHCPDFTRPTGDLSGRGSDPSRPGIVHRLDRFTSGVMVVAKTQRAFNHLALQAREHSFDRRYLALVRGEFKEQRGKIDAAIGRSLSDGSKMTVTSVKSRHARTHFEVLERLRVASLLALQLETGRTHQIRVHLRFAGRPVLGDPIYGTTDFRAMPVTEKVRSCLDALNGQALHAELLGLTHPESGERLSFSAAPPEDFEQALAALREWNGQCTK